MTISKDYRAALQLEVYGESGYKVADDPLAKDAANLLRRRREFETMKPIETAPKDRIILLAKGRDGEWWWFCRGCWSEEYARWWDQIEPSGLADPSHWRDLPEFPS